MHHQLKDQSPRAIMSCFPATWLFSLLLLILTHVTLHADVSSGNQPALTLDGDTSSTSQPPLVQCPGYESTYCNITYQYCDQDNPQCLNCRDICDRLPEESLLPCRTYCPRYHNNAVEAAAKLSTTQVNTFTTKQTDPRPTSPGSPGNISEMSAGSAAAIGLSVIAILLSVLALAIVIKLLRRRPSQTAQNTSTADQRGDPNEQDELMSPGQLQTEITDENPMIRMETFDNGEDSSGFQSTDL